jgi:hypothetical protein
MTLRQRWIQTTLANKLMVITTAIVAFGTLFYAGVAIFQWRLMKESANQTSSQIDKLITESRRISDTSSETANQAKRALDATIENFRLEQRAWVGPTQVETVTKANENQRFKVNVSIVNSGKTPALRYRSTAYLRMIDAKGNPELPKEIVNKAMKETSAVMQPGMTFKVTPEFNKVLSKADIDDLLAGKSAIYLVGIINYEDVFGRPHSTKICIYLAKDLAELKPCSSGNEAN